MSLSKFKLESLADKQEAKEELAEVKSPKAKKSVVKAEKVLKVGKPKKLKIKAKKR